MGYIWIFLAIDSELNLPPGTFYKTIGIAFGGSSGLGSSFSSTKLWINAANIT
jgi:hypothetical protein